MTTNIHNAAHASWSKWSEKQRTTFNRLMSELADQSVINARAGAPQLSHDEWETVRFNAAFLAAHIAAE